MEQSGMDGLASAPSASEWFPLERECLVFLDRKAGMTGKGGIMEPDTGKFVLKFDRTGVQ